MDASWINLTNLRRILVHLLDIFLHWNQELKDRQELAHFSSAELYLQSINNILLFFSIKI